MNWKKMVSGERSRRYEKKIVEGPARAGTVFILQIVYIQF